jgi:ethanolamine utilization protein EutN
MRLGHVIGKVTLSAAEAALRGGRFLMVQPFGRPQFGGAGMMPLAKGATIVVYDELGADVGQVIGFTEGAEAAMPFTVPTPVDAYNAAIVENVFYTPPGPARPAR